MSDGPPSIGADDLEECWCCGGLHDGVGKLCGACSDAGCQHFGGECEADHEPVLPDGGENPPGMRGDPGYPPGMGGGGPDTPRTDGGGADRVGPIVFANENARHQLTQYGEVVTFRAEERTTGSTWWRESRTGEKRGECVVHHLHEVDPSAPDALRKYRPLSGFPSVGAWQAAIEEHHGGLDPGRLYFVTTDVPVGLTVRSGSTLKRAAANTDGVDDMYVERCRNCRNEWDARRLYMTGSVLRCPTCDGVMRP